MDCRDCKHPPCRFARVSLSFLVLIGLLVGVTWSSSGLANESEPVTETAADCLQPDALSARGAEILCEVTETNGPELSHQAGEATPVPVPDALDGDPLDGPVRDKRPPNPDNLTELSIVQSGRQKDTPNSTTLYDGNLGTVWSPQRSGNPWVWFDLGETESVRTVRWLGGGSGDVEIAVSNDRQHWTVLTTERVNDGWQDVDLREDAQYVRLTLLPDGQGVSDVELAEVDVFGREKKNGVDLAQAAESRKKRQEKRKSAAQAQDAARTGDESDDNADTSNSQSGTQTSAKQGKTKCSGKRERCRARPGKVDVTDDCGGDGTCTIDIRADGGSAECDASGRDEDRAGDGEGKRGGGSGGRCEAIADGGTVTIGDVNP